MSTHKRQLLTAFGLVVALGLVGFLVMVSGIIPIKASAGHWAITRWVLQFAKARSVSTYSAGVKVPDLKQPSLILKGAGHFETGCAPCHGSPTRPQPRVAEEMLPRPPNLKFTRKKWEPEELFHIVKHGIKLTGMPAWPARQRDDEVWAIVALLQAFPELTPAEYTRLARGDSMPPVVAPIEGLSAPPPELRRALQDFCARCHGPDGQGRGQGGVPRLAGQRVEYMAASLEAYARGERFSGIMEPVAAGLDRETRQALARYFAQLKPGEASNGPAPDPASVERGKAIAFQGVPRQGVPACIECHPHDGSPRNPIYPVLTGLHPDYLQLQLELFKKRQRGGTPYAHLMRMVAGRLTPEQMRDVVAYWGSLPPHEHPSQPSHGQ